ncbi:type III pantothenate kinase [Candidatus Thioglobus sp.]|uniref:type III pantothenate kinase n=1 Tax=Candidatus Thioglobus sp. TaxID=2026721 RepID=UPI003D152EC9
MSYLFLDVGNTAVKWYFDGQYYKALIADFKTDLLPKADQIFASCVANKTLLDKLTQVVFIESPATFKNFKSAYTEPQNLGVDRFLAMIACIDKNPNQDLLIIDAGTALTFDLVLANGAHQGGLIMPGLGTLRRSFKKFSSDSKNLTLNSTGANTPDAWDFGTANMLMSVINTQIEQHQQKHPDLKIILTGGDAKMIALRLQYLVKIQQNLVLDGLALITQSRIT